MPRITLTKVQKVGGVSKQVLKNIDGTALTHVSESVPAAKAGVTANNVDADTGEITAASASHGITTGMKLDMYWAGGARRGVTVGTVAGTTIPIDLGAGDNLPANGTAVTFMEQQQAPFTVDGDDLLALTIYVAARGYVALSDAGGEELFEDFLEAGTYEWHLDLAAASPIAGDSIITVQYSHADSTAAREIVVAALV